MLRIAHLPSMALTISWGMKLMVVVGLFMLRQASYTSMGTQSCTLTTTVLIMEEQFVCKSQT